MCYISPERDIILDFLRVRRDAHVWQLQPSVVAAESGYGMDGIQSVDWYPVGFLIKESALGCGNLEDLLSDHGVHQTDFDDGAVARPPRFDVLEGVCDLKDHLEGLEEASPEYTGAESACPGEYFYHTGGSGVLSYKALKGEANQVCKSVSVEETLPSSDLLPVHPGRNVMCFLPELRQICVLFVVLTECFEQVSSADLVTLLSELFMDLLDLLHSRGTKFVTLEA